MYIRSRPKPKNCQPPWLAHSLGSAFETRSMIGPCLIQSLPRMASLQLHRHPLLHVVPTRTENGCCAGGTRAAPATHATMSLPCRSHSPMCSTFHVAITGSPHYSSATSCFYRSSTTAPRRCHVPANEIKQASRRLV